MVTTDQPSKAAADQPNWRADGPFDFTEVDLSSDEVARLDLGALIVTPPAGGEVHLQVREGTEEVLAALCTVADSALELSLFAAPRRGDYWPELRELMAADVEAAGGQITWAEGPFGTELRCILATETPDGQPAVQPTRTFVAEGDRWLLRGVFFGAAAHSDGTDGTAGELFDVFRDTIVHRSDEPMAPGELIALTLPDVVG